ncbi:hypothetical protein GTS_34430 [Gandjariella thermophila]|uniref:Dienelactone hydrolase domain-containing protein n=1 Tax=Gandjariella thermophila TaxID=1931992 RepID=A0A4D4J9Y5_9PSEU|nr:hypothetical protein GTS_34430 [Gandjariella thermophila]
MFYPGWLTGTDIALSRPEPTVTLTAGIAGRLLFLTGEDDHLVTADQVRQIIGHLADAGVRHEMVVYPDTPYGFFCEERDTFRQARRRRVAPHPRPARRGVGLTVRRHHLGSGLVVHFGVSSGDVSAHSAPVKPVTEVVSKGWPPSSMTFDFVVPPSIQLNVAFQVQSQCSICTSITSASGSFAVAVYGNFRASARTSSGRAFVGSQ